MDPKSTPGAEPAIYQTTARTLWVAYGDLLCIETTLFGLTLAILYVSAHATLRRPPSAAPSLPHPDDADAADDDDGKNDKKARRRRRRDRARARKDAQHRELLTASDALLLPFVAAAALIGLYFLIQYLQDPALLNRVLRAYTSVTGVAMLGKLLGDALHMASSAVFPNVWVDKGGVVYRVDAARERVLRRDSTVDGSDRDDDAATAAWTIDPSRTSPFPDRLARWLGLAGAPATRPAVRAAWTVRRLVTAPWTVRVAVRGVYRARVGGLLLTTSVAGPLLAVGVATAYHTLGVFPDLLSNALGLGFCYGGLALVACPSFGIASMILLGLFVYDIVMVFYTPFMVTVATKLDVPIKLVASSGSRSSLLGLGDIVVPGIFVCLCLRYDLYRHYARQIKHVDTVLETETRTTDDAGAAPTAKTTTTTTTAVRAVKAPYVDPQGRWGDRLWLRGAVAATPGLRAARFPKPYFRTAMVAYTVGMALATAAMLTTKRGQPALLYLVPSLVGATWARALWTGDVRDMWAYTEDGSQDVADVVVDVAAEKEKEKEKKEAEKDDDDSDEEDGDGEDGYDVFTFAIQAPGTADAEVVVI